MDGWMDRWINGYMDRWIDGWMDEWMDGWKDRQTDRQKVRQLLPGLINVSLFPSSTVMAVNTIATRDNTRVVILTTERGEVALHVPNYTAVHARRPLSPNYPSSPRKLHNAPPPCHKDCPRAGSLQTAVSGTQVYKCALLLHNT
jgi:hypothetical protein